MKKFWRIGGWWGIFLILFFIIKPTFGQAQTPAAVVINELAWAGSSSSSSDEWIELLNTTDEDIDLTGWQITKNTGTESLMISIIEDLTNPEANIITANGYFLISHYDKDYEFDPGKFSVLNVTPNLIDNSITLSNTKLLIKLYQGTWDSGGMLQDTAGNGSTPLAGSNSAKTSMERNEVIEDGSLLTSWHEATSATNLDDGVIDKGTPLADNSSEQPNIIVTPMQPPNSTTANEADVYPPSYSNALIISELYPNPSTTSDDEFIEIYNTGSESVNLNGWKLDDMAGGGSAEYIISTDIIILPDEYIIFTKSVTHIALNDTGDYARLLQPDDNLLSQTPNYGTAPKGYSYSYFASGWEWSKQVTPGEENISDPPDDGIGPSNPNDSPTITLDYEDLSSTSVLLNWDITLVSELGDLKIYQSEKSDELGELIDTLDSDEEEYLAENLSSETAYYFRIKSTSGNSTIESNQLKITTEKSADNVGIPGQVRITELLPNPEEDEEWIELCNYDTEPVDISNWKLMDASHKTYVVSAFDFPDIAQEQKLILEANQYLLIGQDISGIRLNNSGGETLSLLDVQNNIIDGLEYDTSAQKGNAYVLAPNGEWFWSEELTPGEPNDISFAGFTEDSLMYLPDSGMAYPKYLQYLLGFILFGIIWFQKKKYANLYYN